ncbi:ATP-binding protein [Amorphus orientalis]|uniref:histidine kinase n=1 Tax=Amorphus orientalis TaxID=649198 RepID=A0AAE4ASR2_9HYPH|nr:ATP-binding protein [Amorphus orientalis]MDQ0314234.1 two-component system osmolarity sensor histidine kinase EnvZ [Amorphus orientalis]
MAPIDETSPSPERPLWQRVLRSGGLPPPVGRWLRRQMPRRLFARSLLIVVVPMILLQSVVAFVFMNRHWQNVTSRLSETTAAEVATLATLIEQAPNAAEVQEIVTAAAAHMFVSVTLDPDAKLPPPAPKPYFSLLDRTLSASIRDQVGRPFALKIINEAKFVEIEVKLDAGILKVVVRRSQAYATNSHITLVWMAGTSVVLIAIAVLFLRNQIRPIQRLADAAEGFGRGRPVEGFRPRGATEVRQASRAFIEMRRRIERQMEQRTAMLTGVSHDLRTILTRFKLELAFLPENEETDALKKDVDAMQAMLEDYLAFARTDIDESSDTVDLKDLLEDLAAEGRRHGATTSVEFEGERWIEARPNMLRRGLHNLIINAARYGKTVHISGRNIDGWVTILIDDDGPGIPPASREEVFRPFYRLDTARNQDLGGTGLGLAISRDAIRSHGGDIVLSEAPQGGLRARVHLPA